MKPLLPAFVTASRKQRVPWITRSEAEEWPSVSPAPPLGNEAGYNPYDEAQVNCVKELP